MRGALVIPLLLVALGGCGSSGPSETRDSDGDGAADAFDAHPSQPSSVDREVARAVKAHADKPGLVSADLVYARMSACNESAAQAVGSLSSSADRC